MNKKRSYYFIGLAVVLLAALAAVWFFTGQDKGAGISRALVAKALTLAVTDRADCEAQTAGGQERVFEGDWSQWYGKYMNYVYIKGWFDVAEAPADDEGAMQSLTYGQLRSILERMQVKVQLPGKREKKKVEPEVWWQAYEEIVKACDEDMAVQKTDVVIFGTPSNLIQMAPWSAYTDQGRLGFEGVGLDAYIDRQVRVLTRNGEIIRVVEKLSDEIAYENVWITEGSSKEATVFMDGYYRTFKSDFWGVDAPEGEPDFGGVLGDIVLNQGVMKGIRLKSETITGKVLAVRQDSIEIEGYGAVPMEKSFRVFKQYGELGSLSAKDILVGYSLQEFVVADGKLCAALVKQDFKAERIRVLLMTDGFSGLLHENAAVTCDSSFSVRWGEEEQIYQGGEVLTLLPEDPRFAQGRITIAPVEEGYTLTLLSLKRNYGSPTYPGTLELTSEEGGLAVVNETYLEDYLVRVVPSEMPASYSLEALKAQAVCARSYACRQIRSNSYSQYGAHVDDSTKFQVYNNIEPQEKATQAVKDTYGQVGYYGDEVIMAYYFSTSCGHTSDLAVWGGSREDSPYAVGRYLTLQVKGGELRDEAVFADFIKDKEYDTFEKNMPWYRWETVIPASVLEKEVPGIGSITGLFVESRGEGGVADQVMITGTEGEKRLNHQDEIRQVLGCPQLTITKKDGSTATGWNSLPSGYFAVETEQPDGGELQFHLYGGGYGHGVGMSQNAAKVMADMGMDYQTILKFFYQGIEVREIGAAQ